jgi:hypothetical protein
VLDSRSVAPTASSTAGHPASSGKAPLRILTVPSNLSSHGSMHSKYILGFYRTSCRVVITSGNFRPNDFYSKTQSIYMQDFPLKSPLPTITSSVDPSSGFELPRSDSTLPPSDFELGLLDYHRQLTVAGKCNLGPTLSHILRYNFSSASVILITSVPGEHTGAAMNKYASFSHATYLLATCESGIFACRYGYKRLVGCIGQRYFPQSYYKQPGSKPDVRIACQCSSLGAVVYVASTRAACVSLP